MVLHPKSARFDWWAMADPGSGGSAFAVLFIAYDRYKPFVGCVDEIYETDPVETATGKIGQRIIDICDSYHIPRTAWNCRYDSAASWWPINFAEIYPDSGLIWLPVYKAPGKKEEGLDTIGELVTRRQWLFSQKCGNAIWEYDNYKRKKGKLVDGNDHQIDNSRYFVTESGVIAKKEEEDRPTRMLVRKAKKQRNYVSLNQDLKERGSNDLFGRIKAKYGEP